MLIRLPTERPKHPSLIPGRKKKVFFFQIVQNYSGGSPASCLVATVNVFSPELKRPWREAYRSTLSTDEVQINP